MLGLSLWAASLVYVRGIKFSTDHPFVAKNRKSKTKQNTRKQLSFWLTKNWCSGLKINVAETGTVHGTGVGAGFRLQSPPLKSGDHSLWACNCDAWGNTNTGSLSFRFFGRFPFTQNFRNFRFGGKWNTFRRFVPLENSQKKWKI